MKNKKIDKNVFISKKKINNKIINIIYIALFLSIVVFFGTAIYIKKDKSFSDLENRFLTKRDDESYKIEDYYKDQFVFRDRLIRLKGDIEKMLLKKQNNDITFAKDNYLIKRNRYYDWNIVSSNLNRIIKFNDFAKKNDINYFVTIIPRGEDILKGFLEDGYPLYIQEELWYKTNRYLKDKDCRYLNMYDYFNKIEDKSKLYYKTDHHWTSYASLLCAKEMFDFNNVKCKLSVGKNISFNNNTFGIETIPNFYGSNYSFACVDYNSPDMIDIYRYKNDNDFITKIYDRNMSFRGFYDYSFKNKKDKYSIFIGGNSSRTDISLKANKNNKNRKKMLVVKDSFANCIVPFLATKYDLILIDPRYYLDSISSICKKENVDNVCLLVNMESIAKSKSFMQLDFNK